MNHWMIFPVIIPLLTAMSCVLIGDRLLPVKRVLGLAGVVASLATAVYMFSVAYTGEMTVYALGNWPIPYGIVFVLDRLSATMVLLTNALALFAFIYATTGDDTRGPYFHFLFLMQIAGVNGAFLTGDIFNLFVFFEILLLSAYVLVVYGSGEERTRSAIGYVFLNLFGSALFLIAVGVLYAVTGTLNMADLSAKIAAVPAQDATLLRAASYLLLIVFSVKAAIFPLYFWLPRAYASVTAPVAAIFAIMTKVGVYALLRSTTLFFGEGQGFVAELAEPYLMPLALITLTLGVFGAAAAKNLRLMIAYLLISSVGTILVGVGLYNQSGISGALYYMIHSTLIMGALFLIADLIVQQRGTAMADRLTRGPSVHEPLLIGMLFFIAMIAATGLPPLTGFIGKVLILEAAIETPWHSGMWTIVLATSFLVLVAAARAGSNLFWKTDAPLDHEPPSAGVRSIPIVGLLLCIVALTIFAGPVSEFMDATAAQIMDADIYRSAILRGGQ